jgi:Tfp pilus assembly protein PilE
MEIRSKELGYRVLGTGYWENPILYCHGKDAGLQGIDCLANARITNAIEYRGQAIDGVTQISGNENRIVCTPHTPYPIPNTLRNKSAFTLIELLVYMAILGFIIVVAGRVFSDSTVMRVRSQNMVKSSEELGRLANLISEDVSQMGAKAYGQDNAATGDYEVVDVKQVYMDINANDSSSYKLFQNGRQDNKLRDSLVFRKIAYDHQSNKFLGVREISWFLSGDAVYRKCRTVVSTPVGTPTSECPEEASVVVMGNRIAKLAFFPSAPGVSSSDDDILFSDTEFRLVYNKPAEGNVKNTPVENKGTKAIISSFEHNQTTSQKEHHIVCLAEKNDNECASFLFEKDETYAIEFKMDFTASDPGDLNSTQFLPGEDHFSVGLRNKNYERIIPGAPPDILIYPPQAIDGIIKRHVEISPEKDISASVVLTWAFYSPKAHYGRLTFSDFKIFRKSDKSFHFPEKDEPDYPYPTAYGTETETNIPKKYIQKKNAKAFEMVLEIDNNGEKSRTYIKEENDMIKDGMVILIPNNGIIAIQ